MRSTPRKNSPMVVTLLVISRAIILFGAWRLFFHDSGSSTDSTDGEEVTYFIGEQVLVKGTLQMADDISQYSHLLTDEHGQQFGLKSFDVALNDFAGAVQVRGEIIGYKQDIPIIQVAAIIGGDENTTSSGTVVAGSSQYSYFASYGLGIRTDAFPGYTVAQVGNDIQIHNVSDEVVMTITPFVCTPNDPLKDCNQLKTNTSTSESFTTAAGITFYNFPETSRRLAVYNNKWGFTLSASSDSALQSHASMLEFLTPTDLEVHLQEARALCRDINSSLTALTSHDIQIAADGVATYTLAGTTTPAGSASCVVHDNPSVRSAFVMERYTATATTTPTPDTKPTPTPTAGTTTAGATTPSPITTPSNLSGWTAYPSVRGWTMYMTKNVVSYYGTLLTGNEQPGCPYMIDLSYRSNASGAASDAVIYECAPSAGAGLQAAGYTRIGATTSVEFWRKDMTNTLKSVEIFIK